MGQVDQKLAAERKKILEEARKIAKGGGGRIVPRASSFPVLLLHAVETKEAGRKGCRVQLGDC